MCGFATMKASGRQEFVIQTKANDTRLLLHSRFVQLGQSMVGPVQSCLILFSPV